LLPGERRYVASGWEVDDAAAHEHPPRLSTPGGNDALAWRGSE
jgi:hypothetical protein